MIILIANSYLFSQCEDNPMGNINNDSTLNILDIVGLVSFALQFEQPSEEIFNQADVNSDELIDVLDVILVVQKVLQPVPSQVSILSVVNSIESLSIAWTENSDATFANYKIYKSSNIRGSIYDRDNKELIIEFNSGKKYSYDDVADTVAANLRRAKSQGVFFNKEIARKYKYKLLK